MEWTERLAVGHPIIDEQHRELFRRFDDLLEACQMRQGREKIAELLEFLDEYVISHFRQEEGLMGRHAYPELASHQDEHRYFVRRLAALRETMQARGPSLDLVISTNQTLLKWIITHIKELDVRFGAFLKTIPARI